MEEGGGRNWRKNKQGVVGAPQEKLTGRVRGNTEAPGRARVKRDESKKDKGKENEKDKRVRARNIR